MKCIVVIGASGALGGALLERLSVKYPTAFIYAFSRKPIAPKPMNIVWRAIDLCDETTIALAARNISESIDMVLVATGVLHENGVFPEKSLKDLSAKQFNTVFAVNTIGPALVMKYFLPKLACKSRSIFAALSARVGSIEDNRLGGWYAYRASKVALNMTLKNASIEMARRNKNAVVVGLHPGTVDSQLSKPFQANVAEDKLFTPAYAAAALVDVLEGLEPADTGKVFDFAGTVIPF